MTVTTAVASRTLEILRECRAIIEDDHFVYDSGQHGAGWIDKDVVNESTSRIQTLCGMLAEAVKDLAPDIICGPATGGLIVAQWTSLPLGCMSVFAEHDEAVHPDASSGAAVRGPFILRRGYDHLVDGKRVLVVDDVVNTGLSIRQTVDAVRKCGGTVIGAAAVVTRGNATLADLGVELFRPLAECRIPSWPAATCELCARHVPINLQYAHGRDYVAALEAHEGHVN